ncbi:GMC family oxidoreductase [Actinoplanes sp. NBRC 103695]|uniref:GMC family oxidoreductase n=1 Tax=Actinoplanes sp. NBRC 103695 TaxID=3032202 RepID=UPI0024A24534|nr:GMC family oxidoreductase [Actinoplanes sp. NBRC 103695]GLY97243.1 choline dehydrogenase [Actinoplanes sp. NBRC 103695]
MESINAGTAGLPAVVDHVVVGAGAAGCVVASRLAEDSRRTVILLEAGPVLDEHLVSTPALAPVLQQGASVHENLTVAQTGLGGRALSLMTGRGLGGGSSVNTLGWLQGQPGDFDGWSSSGALGWSWENIAPYLRASEDHELGAGPWHGAGGPIAVSTPRYIAPLTPAFLESCEKLGIPVSDDLNGERRIAAGLVPGNIRAGRRSSVVTGYLAEAIDRDNLDVRVECPVTSLIIENGQVTGVRCGTDGGTEILVRRGVVLAAGAIHTPKLLMLSGVGPADHLREVGVPVIVDLPGVGGNLRDHPLLPTLWPVLDAPGPREDDPESSYRLMQRGPLSSSGQALAAVRSSDAGSGPDLHLVITPTLRGDALAAMVGPVLAATLGGAVLGVVGLLAPDSVGTVRLASSDFHDTPRVDPGYLSAPNDLTRMTAGLQQLQQIFTTDPLGSHLGPMLGLALDADREQTEDFIRGTTGSYYHPVGTAKIGLDETAVCTPRLQVRGLRGLHIADTSVFPTIVRANTHSTAIAVAERAAELIREDS